MREPRSSVRPCPRQVPGRTVLPVPSAAQRAARARRQSEGPGRRALPQQVLTVMLALEQVEVRERGVPVGAPVAPDVLPAAAHALRHPRTRARRTPAVATRAGALLRAAEIARRLSTTNSEACVAQPPHARWAGTNSPRRCRSTWQSARQSAHYERRGTRRRATPTSPGRYTSALGNPHCSMSWRLHVI